LGYLSLAGLIASVGRDRSEMCLGCFVGEYPNVPPAHQMLASTGSAQA
jgi:glutamine phosphoribosylpyrophosphate amidotransferase